MLLMRPLRGSQASESMMSNTLTAPKPNLTPLPGQQEVSVDGLRNGSDPGSCGGDDRLAKQSRSYGMVVERYKLGVSVGFGGIVMVFAAFTSAMVVRSGLGEDWRSFDLPGVLWLSTAVLLASSFAVEKARRALKKPSENSVKRWLLWTGVLGLGFLFFQWLGWLNLNERGLYLAANPSHSFFYVLTATHGMHLLGGLIAITYVTGRVWYSHSWKTRDAAIEATALYWHFMDALWLYLFVLLLVWR